MEFTSSVFIINVDDEPVIGRGHVSFSADEPSLRSERQRKPPKNFLSRSLVLHQRASIFWEQQAIQEYEDKNGWEVRYGVEKFTRIFFPKREHLPWWVFLFLLFFVLIPAVITICLFTVSVNFNYPVQLHGCFVTKSNCMTQYFGLLVHNEF